MSPARRPETSRQRKDRAVAEAHDRNGRLLPGASARASNSPASIDGLSTISWRLAELEAILPDYSLPPVPLSMLIAPERAELLGSGC